MTVKYKIYSILSAYQSFQPPVIGGGYVPNSHVESDLVTSTHIVDEDIPAGTIQRGVRDTSLLDYLQPFENYSDKPIGSIARTIYKHYNNPFRKNTKQAYIAFAILNRIISDIESEPTVLEAFGWK